MNTIIQPKPVFDSIDNLDKLPYPVITDFLQSIPLDNITQEYHMILNFLKSYTGSPDTFNAYRREVEKLIQWSWLLKGKKIQQLSRDDLIEFLKFIQNPTKKWITIKTVKRFLIKNDTKVFNPEWRPFVVRISKAAYKEGKIPYIDNFTLSKSSIQATFATMSTFFTYLTQEQYMLSNPMSLIRQKNQYIQKQQNIKVTRKLSNTQWETVIRLSSKTCTDSLDAARTYFILSCFYLLGLRISEMSETPGRIPRMGDFAPDHNSLWWFTTVSKGNKLREVAVPNELLNILKDYRRHRGLSPLPSRGEQTPLLHKQRGKNGLGTRQVRNIVQQAFNNAIIFLQQSGKEDDANDLESATVHWLRHTAISHEVQYRPREHIRDDVGHSNPATMDKYIDIDRQERHDSAVNKTLLNHLK